MKTADTYILFELAGATYGLPSTDVTHIEMLECITPVPNTAPAVDGVVFSRGQVMPAVNLRRRFGLPAAEPTLRTRLLFLQVGPRQVALIVDAAREFRVIPPSAIRAAGETIVGLSGNYIQGVATVGDRMVLLLNVVDVLNLDEVILPESAAELTAAAR